MSARREVCQILPQTNNIQYSVENLSLLLAIKFYRTAERQKLMKALAKYREKSKKGQYKIA